MQVRDMAQKDISQIQAIHAKRPLGFELPDLTRKLAVEKVLCIEDRIIAAAVLRPTTEAYLICDPTWQTPWLRWQAFQKLHGEVLEDCRAKDIFDTHAFICPEIARSFGRRLGQLGWWKSESVWYSRRAAD